MPNDQDERLERIERFIDQLQGFVAQQMVMNARLERRHEEHEARFALHEATLADQDARLTQGEARLAQGEAMLDELRGLARAQEAHNQALYVMHEELRLAFVSLEQRLARIEGLLEQNLRGGENGRHADGGARDG